MAVAENPREGAAFLSVDGLAEAGMVYFCASESTRVRCLPVCSNTAACVRILLSKQRWSLDVHGNIEHELRAPGSRASPLARRLAHSEALSGPPKPLRMTSLRHPVT